MWVELSIVRVVLMVDGMLPDGGAGPGKTGDGETEGTWKLFFCPIVLGHLGNLCLLMLTLACILVALTGSACAGFPIFPVPR